MLVTRTPHGLYLPAAGLHLDARTAPGTVFVSHAHSDHCTAAERILCTPETAALHEARRGAREAVRLPYGESLGIGEARVTLTPAGHALGSAMIVSESAEGRAAYTGDFKLRANPFSPPAEIPRVDELVMECTFGEPRYRFPPDEELIARLYAFVDAAFAEGAVPVVLAYALGKGQEALWHLVRAGYDVAVHGAIANLCDLHVALGHPFPGPGSWSRYRRAELQVPNARRVLLTTPNTRKAPMVQKLPAKRTCLLTGWALHPGAWNIYKDLDLVLPLSDHADFDELVRTATESGARKVYTVHGLHKFAEHLRSLGIDAEHLADHPQTDELAPTTEPDEGQLGLAL
ncbi:DNA ligase I, ATP-dependent Dnl1 [Gemmatirosa kalamazoonensis]|uniref:DNA ligase I, ATP-dependent Dnl1 n=1 Tax=Gemmatirosa kalamazoonensis TaxID=861299 RepID=W0REF3_9BACT|nr:MBL fold metallo-hydrolase [Gemmatirosa kalamazoonensis]AHG88822.1 DNA ligase I, ATP-dependent Dnl1 [Gemmatirosa kalamazoonensis]